MSLETGFKFKDYVFNTEIVSNLTYDELVLLIERVTEDINSCQEFISPYSAELKSRSTVPENVMKKLRYKDALGYFNKELKECLHFKKIGIEKAFFIVCKETMEDIEFATYFSEAEKLHIIQ